ncbi:MAG: hypothetical protein HY814_08155 [Candidatus Riflebacteria bacterium]|nr:hypothetical protein [Candidatus Riflebacteria bacterium]
MENDPVIDRIREARHRSSEECGHDPVRLVEYFLRWQEQHACRLLRSESEDRTQQTGFAQAPVTREP